MDVWAFVGQVLFQLIGDETETADILPCNPPESLWGTVEWASLSDTVSKWGQWVERRGTPAWWQEGSEHLHRFVRLGLLALLNREKATAAASYRYLRVAPLLAALSPSSPVLQLLPNIVTQPPPPTVRTQLTNFGVAPVNVRLSIDACEKAISAATETWLQAEVRVPPLRTYLACCSATDVATEVEKIDDALQQMEEYHNQATEATRALPKFHAAMMAARTAVRKVIVQHLAPTTINRAAPATVPALATHSSRLTAFKLRDANLVTVSGGSARGIANGPARLARFASPMSIVALPGPQLRLLIADTRNSCLRLLEDGKVTTVVGQEGYGYLDGPVGVARLDSPSSISLCKDGSILIADTSNNRIRRLSADLRVVSTVAGARPPGSKLTFADGPAAHAIFSSPTAAVEWRGCVVVADSNNHRLRLINAEGEVTTLAGNGEPACVDGWGCGASLCKPTGLIVMADDTLLFTDSGSHTIRRCRGDGQIETVTGQAGQAGHKDGPVIAATFAAPSGLCELQDGSVLVCDRNNHCVRLITARGEVRTVAGEPAKRGDKDGPACASKLSSPAGLAVGEDGSVFIADSNNHSIRRIIPQPSEIDRAAARLTRVFRGAFVRHVIKKHSVPLVEASQVYRSAAAAAHGAIDGMAEWGDILNFHCKKAAHAVEMYYLLADPRRLLSATHMQGIILTSPTIAALRPLLAEATPWPEGVLLRSAQTLTTRVRAQLWLVDPDEELKALLAIVCRNPALHSELCCAGLFRNVTFSFPVTNVDTLRLLGLALLPQLTDLQVKVQYEFAAPNNRELRLAALEWLQRVAVHREAPILPEGQESPFDEFAHAVLRWWAGVPLLAPGASTEPLLATVLQWLAFVHIQHTLLGAVAAVKGRQNFTEAIRSLQLLPEFEYLGPTDAVSGALLAVLRELIVLVGKPTAFKHLVLLEQTEAPWPVPLAFTERPWSAWITCEGVLSCVAEDMQAATTADGQLSLKALLERSADVWPSFVAWYCTQHTTWRALKLPNEGSWLESASFRAFDTLFKLGLTSRQALQRDLTASETGAVTVSELDYLVSVKTLLEPAWVASGLTASTARLGALLSWTEEHLRKLRALKQIGTEFLPESEMVCQACAMERAWQKLTLKQVAAAFSDNRFGGPGTDADKLTRTTSVYAGEIDPFPLVIVQTLPCLSQFLHSELFHWVWAHSPVSLDVESMVISVLMEWRKLWKSVSERDMTFVQLEELGPLLGTASEMALLAATAPGLSWEGDEDFPEDVSFKPVPSTDNGAQQLQLIRSWLHLKAVRESLVELQQRLDAVSIFVSEPGQASVEFAKRCLVDLGRLLGGEWDAYGLADLPRFDALSRTIDPRLVALNHELAQTLCHSLDLLDWLRTQPNDQQFTVSIEVAMSKTDMQCPDELLVKQEGQAGRPDEQKLSMLMTVRSYLHPLIFRVEDRFEDLSGLVQVIGLLGPPDERTVNALQVCNEYRLPLIELLEGEGATVAPNRLRQLMQPSRNSCWVVSNANGASTGEMALFLEYVLTKQGKSKAMQQGLDELLEFQSTLVLTRTVQHSKETQEAIDNFVEQFNLVQQLRQACAELSRAGHFDYQVFRHTAPLSGGDATTSALRLRLKTEAQVLKSWLSDVEQCRSKHYFLNFFSMRQLAHLVSWLSGGPQTQETQLARDILHCAGIADCSAPASKQFAEALKTAWDARTVGSADACQQLEICGEALGAALHPLAHRQRPVTTPLFDKYSTNRGIRIVPTTSIVDEVFFGFLQCGYLPEAPELVFCGTETGEEAAHLLLLRWANAHRHNRPGRLYCLAGIDFLPFDAQTRLALELNALEERAENPLLIVSLKGGTSHVAHACASKVTAPTPPPKTEALQKAMRQIAEKYTGGISVYKSNAAGAGKSFTIRVAASRAGRAVIHAPINASLSAPKFVQFLQNCSSTTRRGKELVHVDIADTVRSDFEALLFQLLILGGVTAPLEGMAFVVSPETAFAVEVAAGKVWDRLPFLHSFPTTTVTPSAATFCTTLAALKEGFGERKGEDAYKRLRVVHESSEPARDPFTFLVQHTSIGVAEQNTVSLWCLWNYVNVLYWQYRQFHDSQCLTELRWLDANEAFCSTSELARDMRAVMSRTARDFATRQIKRVAKVEGLEISLHSVVAVNGLWTLLPEQIDGQPAFTRRTPELQLYLYFRKTLQIWVVTDALPRLGTVEPEGEVITSSLNQDLERTYWTTLTIEFGQVVRRLEGRVEVELNRSGTNLEISLLGWNETNHECIVCFKTSLVVLAKDERKLFFTVPRPLSDYLRRKGMVVGEDLDVISSRQLEILAAVTDIPLPQEGECSGLLDKSAYCLTGDNLLKMLAIVVRMKNGIPIVLMGECGCGKTMLIRFLCQWLRAELVVLDVHGGTTEADILGAFDEAEQILRNKFGTKQVFVFLDEINTCAHMGLITEAICHRSVNGRPFHPGILPIAACNPYRRRVRKEKTVGLMYKYAGAVSDPMDDLVYRVHAIPGPLQDLIFDFGTLAPDQEKIYIRSMVGNVLGFDVAEQEQVVLTSMIFLAQLFVRQADGDPSATSLRDVKRCLLLIKWFRDKVAVKSKSKVSPLSGASVLAVALVYYYRLSTLEQRTEFWRELHMKVNYGHKDLRGLGWHILNREGALEKVLFETEQKFCKNIEVEPGIALTQALIENLFVVIISILTRTPVFLVGSPGTSKTLTMQIVASNLQGKQSRQAFWRDFPAVYLFQYQCSPMSTSAALLHQFEMARRYQLHSPDVVTVLLLDEVGLAEHSPDMPLKVLHAMLVDPPIAIVGLSNWKLDSAKMNRAICLQRTEPTRDEIYTIGEHILASSSTATSEVNSRLLEALAQAYHDTFANQSGRGFIGMRDYYCLVKLLRRHLHTDVSLSSDVLSTAVLRNFGGRPDAAALALRSFLRHALQRALSPCDQLPTARQLIRANLSDTTCRNLMVLTRYSAALPMLYGCKLLNPARTTVLVGSDFPDDQSEVFLIRQINEVKVAMATGATVVLVEHDNIYEALYDVLNQRYVLQSNEHTSTVQKMLRLAVGMRSQLCPVVEGFKVVVIVDQHDAYTRLDLPLLNRFEKQVLLPSAEDGDLLGPSQKAVLIELKEWVNEIVQDAGYKSMEDVFFGVSDESLACLVARHTGFTERFDPRLLGFELAELKVALARVALPLPVAQSPALRSIPGLNYLAFHSSLSDALAEYCAGPTGSMLQVITYSPTSHLARALPTSAPVSTLSLVEIPSEKRLNEAVQGFFQSVQPDDGYLLIQYDPITTSLGRLRHTAYICGYHAARYAEQQEHAAAQAQNLRLPARHIIIVVHVPPAVKSRSRSHNILFLPPWQYIFVDDLRPAASDRQRLLPEVSLSDLLQKSVFELITERCLDLKEVLLSRLPSVLAQLVVPAHPDLDLSAAARLARLHRLLQNNDFCSLVETLGLATLESVKDISENGLHAHTALVLSPNGFTRGSLRESLALAAEALLIRAFSVSLRQLDQDFNLALLDTEEEGRQRLWFSMATCHRTAPKAISQRLVLSTETTEVPNSGNGLSLRARFMFSFQIIEILEGSRAVVSGSLDDTERATAQLNQVCLAIWQDIVAQWNIYCAHEPEAYLHDYVASKGTRLTNLAFEDQLVVHRSILTQTVPTALSCPAATHAATWKNEERIYHVSSLLAHLPTCLQGRVVSDIASFKLERQNPARAFDRQFLVSVFQHVWREVEATAVSSTASLEELAEKITAMLPHFEPLAQTASSADVSQKIDALRVLIGVVHNVVRPGLQHGWNPGKGIRDIVACCNGCNHTNAFVTTLFTKLSALVPPTLAESLGNCVAYYAEEVVASAQEIKDAELLSTFLKLLSGATAWGLPPSSVTLSLRRRLLHILKRLPKGLPDNLGSLGLVTAQLYLQYTEDVLRSKDRIEDADEAQITNVDVPPEQWLNSSESRKRLDSIANCRLQIERIVRHLAASPTVKPPQHFHRVLEILEDPSQSQLFLRTYLLSLLFHTGGTTLMGQVMAANIFSWLPVNVTKISFLPDVYPQLEGYAATKERLTSALLKKSSLHQSDSGDLLLPCLFAVTALTHAGGVPMVKNTVISGFLRDHAKLFDRVQMQLAQWAAANFAIPDAPEPFEVHHLHVTLLCLACSTRSPGSFFFELFRAPESYATQFFPTMPEDAMAVIMGAVGRYGWYVCPKGHPYSVGGCTKPMEESRCPQCHMKIGGTEHELLKTNKALTTAKDVVTVKSKRGYILEATVGSTCDSLDGERPSRLCIRIMRFLIHGVLRASLASGNLDGVQRLLFSGRKGNADAELALRMHQDWHALREMTEFSDCDLALFLDSIALTLPTARFAAMEDVDDRSRFEGTFESAMQHLLRSPKWAVGKFREQLAEPELDVVIRTTLGLETWHKITESYFCQPGLPPVSTEGCTLWRTRQPITIPYLRRCLDRSPDAKSNLPALSALLQESTAPTSLFRYIPDVLAWHAYLFEAFPPNTISREQASHITNAQAVERLPAAKQDAARDSLVRFCEAFNTVLPRIENLFECQRNPFIGEDGRIDLSTTRAQGICMSNTTPICFSLPCMTQGEADAPGLCTIQILNLLVTAHNTLLQSVPGNRELATSALPIVSYRTNAVALERQLIKFDLETDLLSLLHLYAVESLAYGEGWDLSFDLHSLEAHLTRIIFAGKNPLNLQIRHFQYAGDLQRTGRLATLRARIPQSDLPDSLKMVLSSEVDTAHRCSRLATVVQDCISFVTDVGGGSVTELNGDVLLREYALATLLVPTEIWAEIAPAALSNHVSLKHLHALVMFLEDIQHGAVEDRLPLKYCKPVPPSAVEELAHTGTAALEIARALKAFLTEHLTQGELPEGANLKQYLTYFDPDLADLPAFATYFPQGLTLSHAKGVYCALEPKKSDS
eukprot:TRINITY_DN6681_c0_g4_i1.p1 TRINITY_DN6681_c0_g4~~TRINITY_DN6681_c0_g4_i1.p1  ORF type:complete len:5149 (+),score=717.09 TRINITY_DN6681_c0_g4_i1:781-15447(+)